MIDPHAAIIIAFVACGVAIICLAGMLLGVLRGWVITRQRYDTEKADAHDRYGEKWRECESWRNFYFKMVDSFKASVDKLSETNERAMDLLTKREQE